MLTWRAGGQVASKVPDDGIASSGIGVGTAYVFNGICRIGNVRKVMIARVVLRRRASATPVRVPGRISTGAPFYGEIARSLRLWREKFGPMPNIGHYRQSRDRADTR